MDERSAADVSSTAGCELVTSRMIEARRERVYRAFSDAEVLARWWGPRGFTNTFYEFDLRPGGRWRFVMHAPNGVDFPNEAVFIDVAPPERVVFRHLSSPRFNMILTFVEEGGKTVVGWRQIFDTPAECERVARYAVKANEQNLDRLSTQVAKAP